MLRVIHSQTVTGAILVDDIDDGLPNKAFHRLGATADPKAYDRETAAGVPKQPCYVPRTQANNGFPLVTGYIDLLETQRVVFSRERGKILALADAGLVSTVDFLAADVAAPTLTSAVSEVADLDLGGTNFNSVSPDVTTVIVTGPGAVTLTAGEITGGGGTVENSAISIPAALVPGLSAGESSAQVQANAQLTTVEGVVP